MQCVAWFLPVQPATPLMLSACFPCLCFFLQGGEGHPATKGPAVHGTSHTAFASDNAPTSQQDLFPNQPTLPYDAPRGSQASQSLQSIPSAAASTSKDGVPTANASHGSHSSNATTASHCAEGFPVAHAAHSLDSRHGAGLSHSAEATHSASASHARNTLPTGKQDCPPNASLYSLFSTIHIWCWALFVWKIPFGKHSLHGMCGIDFHSYHIMLSISDPETQGVPQQGACLVLLNQWEVCQPL